MTEHVSETIKYAIRLPNGELVPDLPDPLFGKPRYRTFPDETTRAILWDDHDDAVRTIDAIAKKNTLWGMSELFVQYSDVVRVRISFEVLDGNEPPLTPDYYTLPDGLEKRIRSLISILEEGEARTPGGLDVPALIRTLKEAVDPIVDAEVEGLSEPRTWKTAAEVPYGITVQISGRGNRQWTRSGNHGYFIETSDDDRQRIVTEDDMDAIRPGTEVFEEVLS